MSDTAQHFAPGIRSRKRRVVVVSTGDLVTSRTFADGATLPLIIEPRTGPLDLCEWLNSNRDLVERKLQIHGGILFRNFGVDTVQKFDQVTRTIAGDLLEYKERSSPRTRVSGNIYTSTDYPAEEPIFLHNENSYQMRWPLIIFFCCIAPAQKAGETPIADVRRVFSRISPETREKFRQKGVMYTRNFGQGLGLAWEEVFQTSDRAKVEEHCRQDGIQVEWFSDNRLRTRAVRKPFMKHPRTGEWVWFNHATFFHVSSRVPHVRDSLLRLFAPEDLPTNSYYGDGSPIEPEVLDELREAYDRETIKFSWEKGDVLLLDNMLIAHGRSRFEGDRKILVGMAEPIESSLFNSGTQS